MDKTIDEVFGESLYRLDRQHYEARAVASNSDKAVLDAIHAGRIADMQACTTAEELVALVATYW